MTFTLDVLIDHRRGSIMRNVGHDSDVGSYPARDHFCSAKSDLLLYSIHHVQPEWEFLLVLLQEPCHFRDHETADPVVERTANVIIMRQFIEAILVGYNCAHMNAERLHFLPVACTAIKPEVFCFW